jgi:hypothetical protein
MVYPRVVSQRRSIPVLDERQPSSLLAYLTHVFQRDRWPRSMTALTNRLAHLFRDQPTLLPH